MPWNLLGRQRTGVRDITDLLTAGTAQWSRLVRSGDVVDLYLNNLDLTGVPANTTILILPPGFRPAWARRLTSSSSSGYAYIGTGGELKYNGTVGTVVISGIWVTSNPFPKIDPGVSA